MTKKYKISVQSLIDHIKTAPDVDPWAKEMAEEMLKEQGPKPVGEEWNECPSCGKVLDRIHDMHYCGVCGQAVKWE